MSSPAGLGSWVLGPETVQDPGPKTQDSIWLRRLFFALALLYVLPFWTVHHLPTVDGPCHTYNAWILRQHDNVEEYPLFDRYYDINWRPYPNWVSHATMALLMFVVPPLIAEKLLVSAYVLLFLGGAWYLVGAVRPQERWLAFLAFPFAFHQLFQFGFYNFSISLALFFFVLGCWWRNRAGPKLAFAVKINFLLWLCYFSHILSFVLALASIGVLWLATWRRDWWRRHLLHIPILLPQIILPLWFLLQGGRRLAAGWPLRRLVRYFTQLQVLITFGEVQRWCAAALATLFLLLLLYTLWRKVRRPPFFQETDGLLLVALLCLGVYLLSPAGIAGGGLLKQRLSLYPYLVLIPWFSLGLERGARKIAAAALAVIALLNLGYAIHQYRLRGRDVEAYLSGLAAVRPNTRVLPLLFERTSQTDPLSHAMCYAALDKGLIDWNNYEAKLSYFQTRFRPSVVLPDLAGILPNPGSLRVRANRDLIDAVYTWKMPPNDSLRERLARHYERVASRFGGELWQRIESPHARPGGKGKRGPPGRRGERRQSRDRPQGLPPAR
jgi:hypothetical protein